jgi:hypothetical protein
MQGFNPQRWGYKYRQFRHGTPQAPDTVGGELWNKGEIVILSFAEVRIVAAGEVALVFVADRAAKIGDE